MSEMERIAEVPRRPLEGDASHGPPIPAELAALGFDAEHARAFAEVASPVEVPARVAGGTRGVFRVLAEAGELKVGAAGRLRHRAASVVDLPVVGDWVAIVPHAGGAGKILSVLPRRTCIVRKAPGRAALPQPLAANVDTLFVVAGLDHDFSVRRIERYVALARASGAVPVVILAKVDLEAAREARIREVEAVASGAAVLAVSARTGDGVEALEPFLLRGRTIALLGSSGVGKSTLANRLLGEERLATGEVRAHDSRGRHTTTTRELIVLPGGALLLDTPGMRELSLWEDDGALAGAFDDVAKLAAACRFPDCVHDAEPGCAVTAAVASGALEPERLTSFRKLGREIRRVETDRDVLARTEKKRQGLTLRRDQKRHRSSELDE
jgi:ribosome biogenesis GTPase